MNSAFVPTTGNPEAHDYLDYFRNLPTRKIFHPTFVRERLEDLQHHYPEIYQRAKDGDISEEEQKASPVALLVCDAIAWFNELLEDIENGIRFQNGDLTHPQC